MCRFMLGIVALSLVAAVCANTLCAQKSHEIVLKWDPRHHVMREWDPVHQSWAIGWDSFLPRDNFPRPTGAKAVFSNRDSSFKNTYDRPSGIAHMRIGDGNTGSTPISMPSPAIHELPTPANDPQTKFPSTFYGEPVFGKFVLILDASGSMAGPRAAALRAEACNALTELTDSDQLNVMSFGTQFPDSTCELWEGLQHASLANKDAARAFIDGPALDPGGGTPIHRVLEKACGMCPDDLDKMFLMTSGGPNATGSALEILAHFPAWWSKFNPTTSLVCVCVGGSEAAVSFMRDLAAEDDSTGVFINVP